MDFRTHLQKYLSEKEIDELIQSFSLKENKGFYLNTNKMSVSRIKELFPNVKEHPIVPNGFLFDQNEYQLGKLVYHELGCYYIQDPSAMLVSHYLKLEPEQRILDLCAAPGGKTTMASLLMKNEGQLLANDLSNSRAQILLQNVERMGLGNVVVTSYDFKNLHKLLLNTFDGIILDAPCSGSGMFRKMSEMKDDWTYEKVLKNAAIQKELILMAYSMLKEGGTLMYSTCSYSFEEDEEVIEYLLANTDAKLEYIEDFAGFYRSPKYPETIHLFPNKFCGEGHYIAKIKKPGELHVISDQKQGYFRNNNSFGKAKETNRFVLTKNLPFKVINFALRPGLFIDTVIGEKSIPSHHYSHYQKADDSIALNKEETIRYLRGETFAKNGVENGYHFVSYDNVNIGVVHAVDGMLKNLYPKGLRKSFDIDDSF